MNNFKKLFLTVSVICLNICTLKCQGLSKLSIPTLNGGLVTRYSSQQIPDNSVQDVLNILFDDFGIKRRSGYWIYNDTAITGTKKVKSLSKFTASDGARYMVAISNGSAFETDGDGDFSSAITGITGLSADVDYDTTTSLGYIWIANGVDSVRRWDGTTASTVATAPIGDKIESWRNRIITSGVSGNLSRIYMSEELDGTSWTTGGLADSDPVILSLGGLDAKPVKCMYAGYKDLFIAMTEDETYAIYGFGQSDFAVRTVTKEIGCIDDKSVQEKDGNLIWLSRRGLEQWSGTEIVRISDPIRDLFDDIISNAADIRYLTDSTQTEWEEGNLTADGAGYPISATQIVGSIEPDRTLIEDTDFTIGTVSDVLDLTALDGSLTSIPQYENVVDLEAEFDLGTYSDTEYGTGVKLVNENKIPDYLPSVPCQFDNVSYATMGWTTSIGWQIGQCAEPTCVPGCPVSASSSAGSPVYIKILDGAVEMISASVANLASNQSVSWTSDQLYTAGMVLGNTYTFRIQDNDNDRYMYKNFTWWGGGLATLHILSATWNTYSITATGYSPTGTYTSKVYDTGLTTPYYSNLDATETKPTNTDITYDFAVSSDGVSFDSWVSVVNGAIPAVNQKRYYKFRANLSHTRDNTPTLTDITIKAVNSSTYTSDEFDTAYTSPVGGDLTVTKTGTAVAFEFRESTDGISWGAYSALAEDSQILLTEQYWQYRATFTGEVSITQIDLPAIVSSGKYITKCFDIGTDLNDWDLFQANSTTSDGGSIAYHTVSGATCGAVEATGASWTAQPNNAKIVVATDDYLGVRATFTTTSYDSEASIQDITVNWNEGGTRATLASVVYEDRYYLSFDSDSDGVNDNIAVLDKNNRWTLFNNMTCYSMSLYNRKWHCGDANDTGSVFLMDTGFSDNGSDFTASFRTKSYAFGDEDSEKEFNKLYVTFKSDTVAPVPVITASYTLDDSSSSNSLGTISLDEDSTAGLLNAKVPFPLTQNLTGKYLDLEFTNTGQKDFTIFGINVYFTKYDVK